MKQTPTVTRFEGKSRTFTTAALSALEESKSTSTLNPPRTATWKHHIKSPHNKATISTRKQATLGHVHVPQAAYQAAHPEHTVRMAYCSVVGFFPNGHTHTHQHPIITLTFTPSSISPEFSQSCSERSRLHWRLTATSTAPRHLLTAVMLAGIHCPA